MEATGPSARDHDAIPALQKGQEVVAMCMHVGDRQVCGPVLRSLAHQKRYCWRSLTGLCCDALRHQPGEWRDAGLGPRGLQEPFAEPEDVQAYRRQDMPQTDPCQPDVAGAS
jgi:hypothetical protein